MRTHTIRFLSMTVTVLALAAPASAWGFKGHQMSNEAATFGVPAEMPAFFHRGYPKLVYLAYEPDRWRGEGPSIDSVNPPDHYLDYEYVAGLELPKGRYEFLELLMSSGRLEEHSLGLTTVGFLPWRIAELCEKLEEEWRVWLDDDITESERSEVEESIIYNSGVLGHYVADASNPHHTTIHYNGWAGAPNTEGYPYDCSAHFRFEAWFVTRAVDRDDVIAAMQSPRMRDDYFEAAMGLILESNSLVETLYRIDRDGGFDPGTDEGKRFAVARLARGASYIRDLWWSVWVRASQPAKE